MITIREKAWAEIYQDWKRRNPQLCGDEHKQRRNQLVRGCKGKALYEGFREAVAVARSLPPREGLTAHVYRCQLCTYLHIGNTAPNRLKSVERRVLAEGIA